MDTDLWSIFIHCRVQGSVGASALANALCACDVVPLMLEVWVETAVPTDRTVIGDDDWWRCTLYSMLSELP